MEMLRVLASTIPAPEILFAKGERAGSATGLAGDDRFRRLLHRPDRKGKAGNGKNRKKVFANHETSLGMSYLGFDQGDPSIIHAGDAVRKVKDATVMGNDNKGPVRG